MYKHNRLRLSQSFVNDLIYSEQSNTHEISIHVLRI